MQSDKTIWIIDDDKDDHELIKDLFKELKLPHPLELFETAEQLLEKLDKVKLAPFIIISDVNLPKMNGFDLREKMLRVPSNKYHSVPFIFWSTNASEAQIRHAYHLMAHGFFKKEASFEQWKLSLLKIIDYWTSSQVPSKQDEPDRSLAP
jgi:DNA-binding NtrC family response regulator